MDANDVELTMKRPYRDNDEVYPVEELSDNFDDIDGGYSYQPKARRQNKWFGVGVVCFVLAIGVMCGAKVYSVPGEGELTENNGELQKDEQGTVTNNADNAKVSEAIKDGKQLPPKKPHSSSYSKSQQQQRESKSVDEVAADSNNNNNDMDPNEKEKLIDQNDANKPDTDDEKHNTNNKPKENDDDEKQKLNAWHKIQVSKSDGPMFQVEEVLSHDLNSFTEGLTYFDGKLYESVGLKGHSNVLVLDPNTGETLETHPMSGKFFGEGLTYCRDKLYQLTYKAKKGFIYDVHNLAATPEEFSYETTRGEGWGFTYDEKHDEFIVSDGSPFLHFWDRETLKQVRKHQIMRLNGRPAKNMNELEFWRDRVVANVWFERVLLIINPVTGLVEKEYDFETIWDKAGKKANARAEVFNGISISDDPDVLYVTGKWWNKMFKVKLLPELDS